MDVNDDDILSIIDLEYLNEDNANAGVKQIVESFANYKKEAFKRVEDQSKVYSIKIFGF